MRRSLPPDRWHEIERLYHSACELEGTAREAFLADQAGQDATLREEVESLLAYDAAADTYLDQPAVEVAARAAAARHPLATPGSRIGGYEVVARLGSGGMGEVYQARDVRLERDVALKVLDRSVAAAAWVHRFEEEARAASGLVHPNIVTIYGVGEDGDLAFIAMELVRGHTLRKVVAPRGPGLLGALDIAVQCAEALAAAHAAGIVHRDLKPENLMLTSDGRLKVLDFGIAKRGSGPDAVSDATPIRASGLTETGQVLGTVGYMSPEQAHGHLVDHRSDQFSFGAILYELLAGARAFNRGSRSATMRAIREADLTVLAPLDNDVPHELRDIILRCLAADPEGRYANTADLVQDLRRIRDVLRRDPVGRPVTRRQVLWLGGAAAVSLAAGAAAWRRLPVTPSVRSLVVLPFTNEDGNPEIEYFCDGITESIIRRVGYVPDLAVRPRSAVFNFKGTVVDPGEAGRRLQADTVLKGTVDLQGGRVVVTASLVDVTSGNATWSERFERRAADLPALQHDLAQAIVNDGLRRPLRGVARQRFDQKPTDDAEALDLFLRGVHEHRLGGEIHYLAARRFLTQAVARDPTFALAHVSLASTFSVMTLDGFERPTAAWPEANRCSRRALELDPELPEAHAEQATAWFCFDHDWSAAEREWTRAVAPGGSPALPDLLSGAAIMIWALGRTDEALAMTRRARALDPLSPRFGAREGDLLLHAGRVTEAARVYEEVLTQSPHDAPTWFGLAEARHLLGQHGEAILALQRAYGQGPDAVPGRLNAVLARAEGEAGYREIDRMAASLELETLDAHASQGAYVSPLDLARGHARARNADRAFEYLDAAFEERSAGLVFLKVDRAWAAVRADKRFVAAVQAVGLP